MGRVRIRKEGIRPSSPGCCAHRILARGAPTRSIPQGRLQGIGYKSFSPKQLPANSLSFKGLENIAKGVGYDSSKGDQHILPVLQEAPRSQGQGEHRKVQGGKDACMGNPKARTQA